MTGLLNRFGPRGVTWLVWRQHRVAFWVFLGGVLALGGYAMLMRAGALDALAGGHFEGCARAVAEQPAHCTQGVPAFQTDHQHPLRRLLQALAGLPLLVGLFLGAPLFAHELESGTYRTALSQSVTRTRWFTAKLAVPAVMTVVLCGLLTAAVTAWWHPVAHVLGPMFPWYGWMPYDALGPAAVGRSLLLFMVGAVLSLVLRRTVAAMGATLVVGAGLLYLLDRIRGSLWPAVTASGRDPASSVAPDGAWVLGEGPLSASGARMAEVPACSNAEAGEAAQCLARHGIGGRWAEYHPQSHLWPLQWVEAGVCLALAGALTAFVFWWARKRLT